MAVAADSSFAVLSLKEVDELKASIDEWDPGKSDSFQPNIEVCTGSIAVSIDTDCSSNA